eukprot:11501301-Prorocentrum_lima.AAC.1
MTSSLVGSEMCIRDRWRSMVVLAVVGVQAWRWLWSVIPQHLFNCVVAVSYTHLTLPTICSV